MTTRRRKPARKLDAWKCGRELAELARRVGMPFPDGLEVFTTASAVRLRFVIGAVRVDVRVPVAEWRRLFDEVATAKGAALLEELRGHFMYGTELRRRGRIEAEA